jgi:hypothetical protein
VDPAERWRTSPKIRPAAGHDQGLKAALTARAPGLMNIYRSQARMRRYVRSGVASLGARDTDANLGLNLSEDLLAEVDGTSGGRRPNGQAPGYMMLSGKVHGGSGTRAGQWKVHIWLSDVRARVYQGVTDERGLRPCVAAKSQHAPMRARNWSRWRTHEQPTRRPVPRLAEPRAGWRRR